VENKPHEYFVTEMHAYFDEDVQPLMSGLNALPIRAMSSWARNRSWCSSLRLASQVARDSQRGLQRRSTGQLTRA